MNVKSTASLFNYFRTKKRNLESKEINVFMSKLSQNVNY